MTSSLAPLKTDRSTSFMFGPRSSSSCASGSFTMSPTSSPALSRSALSISSGASVGSSSSDDGSQTSDGSASGPEIKDETEETEPVFSSIPTRRAKSSTAISRFSGNSFTSPVSNNSSESNATVPPRRTPSFPVSKALRPFDSISNAMGTNNKRVTPPMSRVEASTATKDEKKVEPQLLEVLPTKPKRSNILLQPPKKNRFQNGFFILDMTQEEFKSRAW